ncbi:MAG: hypothetical protein NTW46_03680 [Candidatus Nealsonbacteria bacterium]|nr:hypothetical protein [Candidatus Nealsonbacteria bacterium]
MPEKFGEQFKEVAKKTNQESDISAEVPDNFIEEERDDRFRERLAQLVPSFLEIRVKMGVKEDVGFGYLPKFHSEGISLGGLPDIKRTKKGDIEYSVQGRFLQIRQEKLAKEEEKNILVTPKHLERKQRIVSIHDPHEEWDTKGEFPHLIDATDDVFVGLIAHELTHSYNSKSKLPLEVRSVLEKRYKDNDPGSKYKWRYDTSDEEEMDIIASSFGYKDQVVANLDFMIDRMNRMGPYFRNKQHIIKSLEVRKQQVLKYCR